MSNMIIHIQSYLKALTKAERKVAEIVLNENEQLIFGSVTDLAEKANVGETTVLRFCRSIGFKSFQEFKFSLAKESAHASLKNMELGNIENEALDPLSAIKQKLAVASIQAIQDTTAILDIDQLRKVVDLLTTARKIHFFGVGSSGVTSLDAKYKFLHFGVFVEAIMDSHLQAMSASTLGPGDVAIGLSVSGSTKDTIDCLVLAKEAGATIVSITHFARSPITKISDNVLLISAKEDPQKTGALSSKIAQLHAIDILCSALSVRMKESFEKNREKTTKSVLNKIY